MLYSNKMLGGLIELIDNVIHFFAGSDRNKSMNESRASRAGPGYTAVTQITSTKIAATKLHAKLGTYGQLFL